jgi:tetratricopeptide (TPR) repeat protein
MVWSNKKDFQITDNDKEWVHESFDWLLKVYGYPARHYRTILFTEEYFPETLSHKQTAIEPLLADLSKLFAIDRQKISFEIQEDIRDTYGTPYELQGKPFECEMEVMQKEEGSSYKLFLIRSLFMHPKRLLFNCLYQYIKIRMSESGIGDADNEDASLFIYLAGIYMGYGVLLAQTMADEGRHHDGFWETKWSHPWEVPLPVMAYAMALFYNLVEEKDPAWKKSLPAGMQDQYDNAAAFISRSSNPFFNKQELMANDLYYEGDVRYLENDFDGAIVSLQKAFFLTRQDNLKATLYNYIGYAWLRKEEYLKSIPNFQKALEINPGFGYANDNLGFAFIMSGDTDSGKYYLNIALQTKNNDNAYSYRNLALYHQKRGEIELAEDNFKKAFTEMTVPVDLLEYFYAKFLFEKGENEKGMSYLKIAVDKGEPEAIDFVRKNPSTNNTL